MQLLLTELRKDNNIEVLEKVAKELFAVYSMLQFHEVPEKDAQTKLSEFDLLSKPAT